ncbi:MAG: twin-arginine translocase TatA/TatE family subunit [Candidatus Omnitrophota bacterium]|nr:twin-arginine translocase TatA/TatE family subunit [Candidatus Omnitrophota bacterium]
MRLGWAELLIIFTIVLLIVGARRLPEVGRSLGQAIREFQRALRRRSDSDDDHQDPRPPR